MIKQLQAQVKILQEKLAESEMDANLWREISELQNEDDDDDDDKSSRHTNPGPR